MTDPISDLTVSLSGRYVIEREIGHGGMARVFLAHDQRHDRPVAIKVLHPELALTLGAERFLREIRITARLNHPHILPLLDSGEAGGVLYYVMPYMAGESLRQRLDREHQLGMEEAVRIATDVAGALAYAHAHGVVHRDIKPENILLASGQAVVADFGIATAVRAAGRQDLTGSGVAIGTPLYMSPEQSTGDGELDGRSDVYSLGCVLFEMVAGRPPFVGPSPSAVAYQHLGAEPPRLATLRNQVPLGVAEAVHRALAKLPADRYPTAEAFSQALATASSISPAARSVGAAPGGRRQRRMAAIMAGGLGLLGLALVWTWPNPPDGPGAATAYPRTAIAVLPFQNLAPDGAHGYFAGGLHAEILTQLARIAGLSVTSQTSVMSAADRRGSVREIAEMLQVGSIVNASVQVVGDRLRVSVQLVDAATDATLWAERYDRTLDDAFAIQSDVAQRIVAAVGAALSAAERRSLAQAPTQNAEAYRLYLQGREYWIRPNRRREDYEAAEALYRQAVALDSSFALARVGLAETHGLMFLLRYDPSPARLQQLRAEAEAAVRLAPDLPKAHEAMGMAYGIADGDLRRGVEAFRRAAQDLPNDARLRQKIGFAYRTLGVWDSALIAFEAATMLDPHDADLHFHLGATLELARRYPEALSSFRRAHDLAPDLAAAGVMAGWAAVRWRGRLDTLQTILEALPRDLALGPFGELAGQTAALRHLQREPERLLEATASARSAVFEWELGFIPVAFYTAWALRHRSAADPRAARAALDTARRLIEARLEARPDDWTALVARGLAQADGGDTRGARESVRRLEQAGRARYDGGYVDIRIREGQARILARIGDAPAAVALLSRLLEGPGWLSAPLLALDPDWDPIRGTPEFTALLQAHGAR